MFYVAKNYYGSGTSVGFTNTWYVLGFATKAMRDLHVRFASDIATRAITSKQIRYYLGKLGKVNFIDKAGDYCEYCPGLYYSKKHFTLDCTKKYNPENGQIERAD